MCLFSSSLFHDVCMGTDTNLVVDSYDYYMFNTTDCLSEAYENNAKELMTETCEDSNEMTPLYRTIHTLVLLLRISVFAIKFALRVVINFSIRLLKHFIIPTIRTQMLFLLKQNSSTPSHSS